MIELAAVREVGGLETNTKVLSGELFLGVVALQTPIQKNHYMRKTVPFPRYCHILQEYTETSIFP